MLYYYYDYKLTLITLLVSVPPSRVLICSDGFLFGFPTRYGRAPAQVSAFFDQTGGLWASGALIGKFAGVFTYVSPHFHPYLYLCMQRGSLYSL
jgi:hypothetical protein